MHVEAAADRGESLIRYYGWLLLLYTLNHGWVLLLAGAIYWDDWVLWGVPDTVILERFEQTGSTWWYPMGRIHVLLLEAGPWIYRLLTYLLMFGAGVALDRVLRRYRLMSTVFRYWVVLLFLVLPLYWARVALIDVHYTICYFLFFLAWAVMGKHRVASLALFFLSFSTNSLLVCFALPFVERCIRALDGKATAYTIGRSVLRNIDYAVLPFIYFAAKTIWFRPFGAYAGYNEDFSVVHLVACPMRQWNDLIKAVAQVVETLRVSASATLTPQFLVAALSAVAVLAILGVRRSLSRPVPAEAIAPIHLKRWLMAGVVVVVLGAFPYWIVGKTPTFSSWGSRHQLLLALGTALVVAALVCTTSRWRHVVATTVLGICTYVNTYTYLTFMVDWHKQQSIVSLFGENQLIEGAQLVIVDDQSEHLNAVGRRFTYYEWSGLLAQAFGNEKRLGADSEKLGSLRHGVLQSFLPFGHLLRFREVDLLAPLSTVRVTIREVRPASWRTRIEQWGIPRVEIEVESLPPTVLTGP